MYLGYHKKQLFSRASGAQQKTFSLKIFLIIPLIYADTADV
jgi:hypothetical protein